MIVKIYVGKERKLYNVHWSLLSHKCSFFEECLNHPVKEGQIREFTLEEENVAAFDQFLLWIYNEPLTAENDDCVIALTYMLADKFVMEAFKNAVVDRARAVLQISYFIADDLIKLCENGLSGSPLAKYFWAQLAHDMVTSGFEGYIENEDRGGPLMRLMQERENLMALMRAIDVALFKNSLFRLKDPSTYSGCEYHEHKETKPCMESKDQNYEMESKDQTYEGTRKVLSGQESGSLEGPIQHDNPGV